MQISFLGGTGTVTGSKYLVEAAGKKILVDCGLFQGRKELRLRNWSPFPFDPASIDAVLLTHAHLDHSGALPILVREGFTGPIIATEATKDLCGILLPDSAFLAERDAEYANRKGFSKHHPAKPLYTKAQSSRALNSFRPCAFGEKVALGDGLTASFSPAGHILGAASIALHTPGGTIAFSGDLGRSRNPVMVDPAPPPKADFLVVESTYGDRNHAGDDPEEALADVINRTIERGGTVLIPSFAVGRAQMLLYYIWQLKQTRRIRDDVPVFLDSPMAINASELFCHHVAEHRLSPAECRAACSVATYVNEAEDSAALDHNGYPVIIISASGMATGGRVLHHLKHFAPQHKNTILFAGFQADGTRGARMVNGEREIKIHGRMVPIRAEVDILDMLSAHADRGEILDWLKSAPEAPRQTFVTHGEANASAALATDISGQLGWDCVVPEDGQIISLS